MSPILRRTALSAALWLLSLRARAQDAALVQPRSYRVVLENAKLRVLELSRGPAWACAAPVCIPIPNILPWC